MVNWVPTTETKAHVQAQRQDYPNNPFRASPKRLCGGSSQEPAARNEEYTDDSTARSRSLITETRAENQAGA